MLLPPCHLPLPPSGPGIRAEGDRKEGRGSPAYSKECGVLSDSRPPPRPQGAGGEVWNGPFTRETKAPCYLVLDADTAESWKSATCPAPGFPKTPEGQRRKPGMIRTPFPPFLPGRATCPPT